MMYRHSQPFILKNNRSNYEFEFEVFDEEESEKVRYLYNLADSATLFVLTTNSYYNIYYNDISNNIVCKA
jgi:hypothetical protein